MRKRHSRLRSLGTVAALAALGGTAGMASAGAAPLSPVPIGPGQTFVGQVNGVTIGAVIKVACFGPVTPTSTGHPLTGQTVSVQLIAGTAPAQATVGYTGASATHDLVGFGNATSVTPVTDIKAYGIGAAIPATLNLPCFGTGTVSFVPAPTSPGAQTATVGVSYVSIGVSSGS
ncbi:hypothetical protein [Actinacidiphila paucisporea]|uniref:Uncharacterized protein n=1 Tax=Actinacidiphila paucisporea TaxID=310782 RepID=A0A1M7NED1_9ACTN|nr:hypothetical protein [Actinacidiphila paucisporea]SHN02020.1 hypothetical protein SAMN05216499_11887 [Actinacidiphila paucisporea]